MKASSNRYYLPQLDALRVLVLLWVMMDHLPVKLDYEGLKYTISFAWIGQELLYIIGVFLFTSVLSLELKKNGKINIRNFYMRRVLRIIPLYYAYILIIFLFFRDHIASNDGLILRAIGLLTFTDNLFVTVSGFNKIPYTGHLYTVSFLMQTYLLLPWLYILLAGFSPKRRLYFFLAILGTAMALRYGVVLCGANRLVIPMIPLLRPEPILAGMALAYLVRDEGLEWPGILKNVIWLVWAIVFVLMIVCIVNNHNARIVDGRQLYLYPMASIAMGGIVFIAQGAKGAISKLASSWPIRRLGKIIYGMYICHFFSVRYSKHLLQDMPWWSVADTYEKWGLLFVLSLFLTIIMASILYHVLERPFLLFKERYAAVPSRPV